MFKQPDPECQSTKIPAQAATATLEPLTPRADRVHNGKAMVLSFTSENSLQFSQVPQVIALTKALVPDKYALDQISIDRTSASYKMTHGLAKTYKGKCNAA